MSESISQANAGPHPRSRRPKLRIAVIVVAAIILIRLALPFIILHFANRSLGNMEGYYGHIEDIDLSLYRGAYQIHHMYLNKVDSATGKQTEFLRAAHIDLSVEWDALLKGSLVGELEIDQPSLRFTKDKTELDNVKKDTGDFRKLLKDFMPLKINRLQVRGGSMHYIDSSSKPVVDVSMKNIMLLATNLNNSYDSSSALPATITAESDVYEGTLRLNMKLDPLAESATFDLNAELNNTNLVLLNNFLKAYGGFDVNRGNFGLYTELAAKDGKFTGYVKPIIKDLDVVGREDKDNSFFRKLWEATVGAAGKIFKNQKEDQVATKIPLRGSFSSPETGVWNAVWYVLRNAFIQALVPSVENQVSLQSVSKGNGVNKKQEKK